MFVADLRREFFEVLRRDDRALVLANLDVDSVCAVKILQHLFKCDQVLYTLVPITGRSDLIRAFRDNVEQGLKTVILINCGATIDLVQDLGLDDEDDESGRFKDVTIFVADSHRPIEVTNVYNDGQIKLLMRQDPRENIPAYDEIFRDDDSDDASSEDEDEEEGDGDGGMGKKKRFDEASILRRQERRRWLDRRNETLYHYQQFSYYGRSTAVLMYDLAFSMSRGDVNDLVWWAIVGMTEQYLFLKSENESHLNETGNLRNHVSRLNKNVPTGSGGSSSDHDGGGDRAIGAMKLAFDKELNLVLYRHWSLYESILHSIYTACRFNIWSARGKQRLLEFLAELGLPLAQCKQNFSSMDLNLRNDVCEIFESKSERYELDLITHGSFTASFGYRSRFCSADVVLAVRSLMENVESDASVTPSDLFLKAIDALGRSRIDLLEEGISLAKMHMEMVLRQVQNFIDTRQVETAGPFLYAVIQEGAPMHKYFSRPNCLVLLAQHTLRAYKAFSSSKKAASLPMVLSAPLDADEGTCIVVGVPPVNDRSRRNLLGTAFEQVLRKTNCRYRLDYFDPSVIQLKVEDRSKFFNGLIQLLQ